MKRGISIAVIVMLGLALIFTQVFAYSGETFKPKQTPEPNEPEITEQAPNAQGKQNGQAEKKAGKHYNFKGEVTAVSDNSLSLTSKKSGTVTVAIDSSTVIRFAGKSDGQSKLAVGDTVIVQAVMAGQNAYTALRVHVIPSKAGHLHRVGVVTAYEAGKTITVQGQGGTTTFQIASDVKILPAERAGTLKIGSRVTIISPASANKDAGTPVAKGIVVHPDKPAQ